MHKDTIDYFRARYGAHFLEDLSDYKPSVASRTYSHPVLTAEQQTMVDLAIQGKNILVDACVGSGKTTSIQALCDAIPVGKRILYLTYSKLLKSDARKKIKRKNITVTNYHGLAYMILKQNNRSAAVGDMVRMVVRSNFTMPRYDVLVLDEYQDLETELAQLITLVKDANPGLQIIAVGDMKQKVQDKTDLDVPKFMDSFLGDHKEIAYTNCFRLCEEHADRLGYIWDKKIKGVNDNCRVAVADINEVQMFLGQQNPGDVLCLGARTGILATVLNNLEELYPNKYNKYTTYASISDQDKGAVEPDENSAIFTTFDSCKGLERKICVVFDFTPSYWSVRIGKPNVNPEILRNIFMVAASRGKELIIFVETKEQLMDDEYIRNNLAPKGKYDTFNISEMFDFKYKEQVEKCYELLSIMPQQDKATEIKITDRDGLIDLSPCIGIYQEAMFFDNYNIKKEFELIQETRPDVKVYFDENEDLEKQVLALTALQTYQERYYKQVNTPYVTEDQSCRIKTRLESVLSRAEDVQKPCRIDIESGSISFAMVGYTDVYREDMLFELKFTSELRHEAYLQCAMYMLAFNKAEGILWNTKTNESFVIRIKDRKAFLDQVIYTITKGAIKEYTAKFSYELKSKRKVLDIKDKPKKRKKLKARARKRA